jgi:hypothetical protein
VRVSEVFGELRRDDAPKPVAECCPSPRRAPLIGQNAAGNAVEPETSFWTLRNVANPPPSNEHDLGDGVGCVFGAVGSTQGVRENRPRVAAKDFLEALARGRRERGVAY